MKRLLFLPLIALPLLVLSCDGQAPTEPDSDSSVPLFAPKPPPPAFSAAYVGVAEISGGDIYTGPVSNKVEVGAWVCPADKGTVLVYACRTGGGVWVNASWCDDRTARWKFIDGAKEGVTFSKCLITPLKNASGNAAGKGILVKYRAQGSGYGNGTISFNLYNGTP